MSRPLEPEAFELLVAEPTVRTEIRIGYARVSADGQKLDRRIFADEKSGKDDLRPELKACHAFLTADDTLRESTAGISCRGRSGGNLRTP